MVVPILVFAIDVIFYVENKRNLTRLSKEHERYKHNIVGATRENYAQCRDVILPNDDDAINGYARYLDGSYRPCLLLSLVLSTGMSIFFRLIILGYRHRDIPSVIMVVLFHSICWNRWKIGVDSKIRQFLFKKVYASGLYERLRCYYG